MTEGKNGSKFTKICCFLNVNSFNLLNSAYNENILKIGTHNMANNKDAVVAIKSFLTTVLIFSLVSFSCVYYNVFNTISLIIIFGITSLGWLIYTKFAYKDPYGFQVISCKLLYGHT